MAKGYRPVDRDQPFLFPPDMREWLPADHPVHLVIAVVEDHLDTSAFHAPRKTGGAGTAGYDPDMLATVLVWAYAHGVTSSRRIEELCRTDVAFRLICAGNLPDHLTVARFRGHFPEAAAEFFAQVLMLVRAAGDGQAGDGGAGRDEDRGESRRRRRTGPRRGCGSWRRRRWRRTRRPMRPRMRCSAQGGGAMRCRRRRGRRGRATGGSARRWPGWKRSGGGARRRRRRRRRGSGRGSGPGSGPGARRPRRRWSWRRRSWPGSGRPGRRSSPSWQARNAAGAPGGRAARRGRRPMTTAGSRRPPPRWRRPGRGPRRRRPGRRSGRRTGRGPGPVRNITDPDSRLMPVRGGGFSQCYNTQNVVSDDELVIATELTDDPTDMAWFEPMMRPGRRRRRPDRGAPPRPDPGSGGQPAARRRRRDRAGAGRCRVLLRGQPDLPRPGPADRHRQAPRPGESRPRPRQHRPRTGAARPSGRCGSG